METFFLPGPQLKINQTVKMPTTNKGAKSGGNNDDNNSSRSGAKFVLSETTQVELITKVEGGVLIDKKEEKK